MKFRHLEVGDAPVFRTVEGASLLRLDVRIDQIACRAKILGRHYEAVPPRRCFDIRPLTDPRSWDLTWPGP